MKSKVIMQACNIVFESRDQTHPKKKKGTFQYHENPNPGLLRACFRNQY